MDVGATEGSGKLAGGLRVIFIANCLANSSALPIEVETISLLEVKGGKELAKVPTKRPNRFAAVGT